MSLVCVQRYLAYDSENVTPGQMMPPLCDEDHCTAIAVGLFWDKETGESPDLCEVFRVKRGAGPVDAAVENVRNARRSA